jgi:hypothetical protein
MDIARSSVAYNRKTPLRNNPEYRCLNTPDLLTNLSLIHTDSVPPTLREAQIELLRFSQKRFMTQKNWYMK